MIISRFIEHRRDMGSCGGNGTSEIVESKDDLELPSMPKSGKRDGKYHAYPTDDDLCCILEAIDLRISSRVSSPSPRMGIQVQNRNSEKMQVQGIGISESVTLKQALRKLCVSQASEMAAIKRPSKSIASSSSAGEAGAVRKLYASVIVQTDNSGKEGSFVEVSLVPEKSEIKSSVKTECRYPTPTKNPVPSADNVAKTRIKDIIGHASMDDEESPEALAESLKNVKTKQGVSESYPKSCTKSVKSCASLRIAKTVERNHTQPKKKGKQEVVAASKAPPNSVLNMKKMGSVNSKLSPAPRSTKVEVSSTKKEQRLSLVSCNPGKSSAGKLNQNSRSREKGECSQSSKSSMGEYSSSTSISEDSHYGSGANGGRPHMSKDVRWVAIQHVVLQYGCLGLKNFKLSKKLGCGDIGTVYLAELDDGSGCEFALKVMDTDFLVSRKKIVRAQTEREILQMLDHPFLPTLYAHFTSDTLSCLVMEYCPGGDLHVLRQKQPGRHFAESAARFYVAEVLLALEYLHMMGVIYRDLKPENILVREDGHIMLSDFDLSLRCAVSPTLVRLSSFGPQEATKKLSGPCAESACIGPFCLQQDWGPVTCFTPRLISSDQKSKPDQVVQTSLKLPQLVVEPTDARSNSFVGTHEYLAPEIIRGDGHGSSVDWWTLGIFLYELVFGKTPFKGFGHEETLVNVVSNSLRFPESESVSLEARDLIKGLLVKEPENRLGSIRGAAEIKTHPFFQGLNWALVRCATPPHVPVIRDYEGAQSGLHKKEGKCLDFRTDGDDVEFELF